MDKSKMNPKYLSNPRLHLRDLRKFRRKVAYEALGQQDSEYKAELDFLLERTDETINEVLKKVV